jgi:hypothetical protein
VDKGNPPAIGGQPNLTVTSGAGASMAVTMLPVRVVTAIECAFFVDHRNEDAECLSMTEYVVTKQGATSDWGSNAEGEVQEMPLSKPDGAGWKLHSVVPSQYNVMAIWEREEKRKKR